MEPRIQYAKTSDGVNIGYWTMGEGMPLVFPGYPVAPAQTLTEDRKWYERLALSLQLIRFDHRGVGISDREPVDYSLEAQALDVLAVMDHLGTAEFALLGAWDSGPGMIAFAANHPHRVSSLILYNTYARGADIKTPPEMRGLRALLDKNWELYVETFARVNMGWDDESARQWAQALRRDVTPKAYRDAVTRSRQFDVTDLLPRVTCPTLVVHKRDLAYLGVATARRIAAGIPNARLLLLEGRLPTTVDVAEPLGDAIDEFLTLAPSPSPPQPADPGPPAASGTAVILFADIANSTGLTERIGDAAFRDNRGRRSAGWPPRSARQAPRSWR